MKNFFNKKKVTTGLSVLLLIMLTSLSTVNAASQTKCAKASESFYSWCDILVYKMGVSGDYHTTGKKIDTYSTTKAVTSTHGTWSVHDKEASWIYQSDKKGTCKAYATFKNGVCTQWFDMAWQTYDRSISAYATYK